MSNSESEPARVDLAPSAAHRELWGSPIATLPVWPLVFLGLGVLFFLGSFDSSALFVEWPRGLGLVFLYAVPLAWWWTSIRRRGHSVREVMGPAPSLQQLVLMLMVTLAMQVLYVGWFAALASLDLVPEYWVRAAAASSSQTGFAPAEFLAVVILGPCAEEILFRGLFFRRSLRRMRPLLAMLWTGLVFGLLHVDPVGSLSFGVVMAALYVQSGTLWIPIAAHAFNNATTSYVGALGDARGSLGWAIAGAQLVCVPWLFWFVRNSLRQLSR